jgi:hypothetical protein
MLIVTHRAQGNGNRECVEEGGELVIQLDLYLGDL